MNSDGKERELKLALADDESYRKLCSHVGKMESEGEQSNYYFDSQEKLRGLGFLLRLRLEKGMASLTLKGKAVQQRGVFVADELEFEVPEEEALRVITDQCPLESLGTPVIERVAELLGADFKVECWGSLENRRRRYRIDSGLLLEIDETSFPDGSRRYEVEVESSDPEGLRQQVESILADAGVHWSEQEKTKSEELSEVLRNIDQDWSG